jgi:cystathionine beta-lyase/cystathionine gamma-synthase
MAQESRPRADLACEGAASRNASVRARFGVDRSTVRLALGYVNEATELIEDPDQALG